MTPDTVPLWLTPQQVQETYGYSQKVIRKAIKDREVRIAKIGRSYRIYRWSIEAQPLNPETRQKIAN